MVKRRRKFLVKFGKMHETIKKSMVVLAFISAFVFMLFNKSENIFIEKTSNVATEVISSAVDVLVMPASVLVNVYDYLRSLRKIDMENQRLREENRRLIIANAKNRALEIENHLLAEMFNYAPPPEATFVTAKVIAEEGNAFAHSVTVYIGGNPNVHKGQVVLGRKGVVGRVEQVGHHYAKIFLVNDINSKIPVMTEKERARGVLVGANTTLPKMMFIPLGANIVVGDVIITSGLGGVFPTGLPVGKVVEADKDNIKIEPFDDLNRLEYVQIVDYKLPDPAEEFLIQESEK